MVPVVIPRAEKQQDAAEAQDYTEPTPACRSFSEDNKAERNNEKRCGVAKDARLAGVKVLNADMCEGGKQGHLESADDEDGFKVALFRKGHGGAAISAVFRR